jgi:hypothetical protein
MPPSRAIGAAGGIAGDLVGLVVWLGSARVLALVASWNGAPGGFGRGLRTAGDAMVKSC